MKKDTQTFLATILSIPSVLLSAHLFHQGIFPEPLALPVESVADTAPVSMVAPVATPTKIPVPKQATPAVPTPVKTVVVPVVPTTTVVAKPVTQPVSVKVRRTRAS